MKSISSVDFGLNRVWKKINEEEMCVIKLEKTFRNCLADNNRLRAIVNEPHADVSFFTDYKPDEIINDQTQRGDSDGEKQMTSTVKGDDESFYDAEDGFSISGDNSEVVDAEDDDTSDSDEEANPAPDINSKINEYDVLIKRNMTATNISSLTTPLTVERRTELPAKTIPNSGGFISIIRKNIGKDLSRISMPVTMNEPVNLLQKLCEELEYCELIKNACDEVLSPSPFERLMYVGAFAFSGKYN